MDHHDDRYGQLDPRHHMDSAHQSFSSAISLDVEPYPFYGRNRNLEPSVVYPYPTPSTGSVQFGPTHHPMPGINLFNPSSATESECAATMSMLPLRGMEVDYCWNRMVEEGGGSSSAGSSRWPRQETLTLLDIRSRLDSKFKEANHKGPLWDEISRIMSEEHGYERSGKKCREKFENLYKYYKKTKDGARQDGKNYRFFRQLDAIYGDSASSSTASTNNRLRDANNSYSIWQDYNKNKLSESLSFSISNSSHDFEASSSENNNDEYCDLSGMPFVIGGSMDREKKKVRPSDEGQADKKSRRLEVKSFIYSHMKKLTETQESWMNNMLKIMEQREQERDWRDIEWRKEETTRFYWEHELWAKERAWIESRDANLMDILKKVTGGHEYGKLINVNLSLSQGKFLGGRDRDHHDHVGNDHNMTDAETWSLIQLRSSLDSSFQDCGQSSHGLWEAIEEKMTSLGHNLTAAECKYKWENMKTCFDKFADGSKRTDND